MKRTLVLLLLWMAALVCGATTVTGTIKVNGSPFTGSMSVQLNFPATTGSYLNFPVSTGAIPIVNGTFASLALDGNDILLPRKTYYAFSFFDQTGAFIARLNYFISGTSFDIGQAVPTPVLTNNVNYLDLLGIRNLSVLNTATFSQIDLGAGTILTEAGISNARSIMSALYSQGYNILHPTSTTCGINEAIADLPTSGGTIVLPPGNCNISGTILISRGQVTIVGQGTGGYSGTSTYLLPSTITQTSTGPSISVAPNSGVTASGVTLRNFALTGGSLPLISLGTTDATSHLRDVTIDGVWTHDSSGPCITVIGNLYALAVSSSSFISCSIGLSLLPSSGTTWDQITLGPRVLIAHNTSDGINMTGAGSGHITANDLHSNSNGGSGVVVQSSASSASFFASHSEFASNTTDGVLLGGGFAHSVFSSSITGSGIYGIDVSTGAGAGSQTLSTGDCTFSSNVTADLHTASGVPWVTVYPQVSQSAVVVQVTPATVHYVQVGLTP